MTILRKSIIALLVLVLALASSDAYAQRRKPLNLLHHDYKPYNFGFTLGINQMLFSIDHVPNYNYDTYRGIAIDDIRPADSARLLVAESNPNFGFSIGIVSNLRLGTYFDLRFTPTLSFGERDLTYNIRKTWQGEVSDIVVRKPIQSTFVEFPLYVKYKSARLNNVRAYIIGGPKYSLDLISDARRSEKAEGAVVKLYRSDIYLDLGVGFDFYNEYFKLGTELRMSYGLRDLLKKEDIIYTDGIQQIRSKIFTIAFNFE